MTDSLNIRHQDADLDAFAARVAGLLLEGQSMLVDLSRHDDRCDRIELRVLELGGDRNPATD